MPYADSEGVPIHYHVEGMGPALVLQHGFTQCLKDWYECGYVSALKAEFQLIMIDARGHGLSGKPHDAAAYAHRKRVGDVVAVLDALGIGKAHYWGYSMGGWIGFGMVQFAANRLDRLVVGGQHPYARRMTELRRAVKSGIERGPEAFLTAIEKIFGPASPEYAGRLRRADLGAYLALAQDRASLDALLPHIASPCLIYCGSFDPIFVHAQAGSREIPGGSFYPLPGLDHAGAFARTDLVVPLVKRFLRNSRNVKQSNSPTPGNNQIMHPWVGPQAPPHQRRL